MKNTTIVQVRCLSLTAILVLLSGCASLTNPYVDMGDYSGVTHKTSGTAGNEETVRLTSKAMINAHSEVCVRPATSMADAVTCAEVIRSRYLRAMGDQANLAAWSGIGLIPLTAYATYLAVDGGHTSTVSGLALGGAAIYAMTSWLEQPERTKIFGLGQEAIQCAISATQPFQLSKEDTLAPIEKHITDLREASGAVESAIDEVNAVLVSLNDGDSFAVRQANALIGVARKRISEAEELATAGTAMLKSFKNADDQLISTVDAINSAINTALSSTIQSLSVLPGILGGMTTMYEESSARYAGMGPIDGSPVVTDEAAVKKSNNGLLSGKVNGLSLALKSLHEKAAKVSHDLQLYSPGAPSPALDKCGIDTSKIANQLVLSTTSMTFTVGDSSRQSFTVSGGNGSYVSVADNKVFDLDQTPAFGGNISVALKGTEPGTYFITIRDINGLSKNIKVTVSAKPAPPGTAGDTAEPKKVFCAELDALTDTEKKLCNDNAVTKKTQETLYVVLNMTEPPKDDFVDGVYGANTQVAVKAFLKEFEMGDEFDDEALIALEALHFQQDMGDHRTLILGFITESHNVGADDRAKVKAYQTTNKLDVHGFIGRSTVEKVCEGRDSEDCKTILGKKD